MEFSLSPYLTVSCHQADAEQAVVNGMGAVAVHCSRDGSAAAGRCIEQDAEALDVYYRDRGAHRLVADAEHREASHQRI